MNLSELLRGTRPRVGFSFVIVWLLTISSFAEQGYIMVQVENAERLPVRGIEIGIEGMGSSKTTGDDGKARLFVGRYSHLGDSLTLYIQHSPPGQDLVMASPWDNRALIPSFEDKPDNRILIIVIRRGDRAALENGRVLLALLEKVSKKNAAVRAPHSSSNVTGLPDAAANLAAVAGIYGLTPEDLDSAIRAWASKTTDPYEAGLGALYERNYPKASAKLQDSLELREKKLAADQNAVVQDRERVADAAFFLGSALTMQGRYSEAATAYHVCLNIRPNDPTILNNAGFSLLGAGNFQEAQQLLLQSLEIREQSPHPNYLDIATTINNVALLLVTEGEFDKAEPWIRKALDIRMRELGPNSPQVANSLNGLGTVMQQRGKFNEAKQFYEHALKIAEDGMPGDELEVITIMNNLAGLLAAHGDPNQAEDLYRHALKIARSTPSSNDEGVRDSMANLASFLLSKGKPVEAENLNRQLIQFDEQALGKSHWIIAIDLNNLAVDLTAQSESKSKVGSGDLAKLAEAESLLRRALEIDQLSSPTKEKSVGSDLYNLAIALDDEGKYTEAEGDYRQALSMEEKAMGTDAPLTSSIRQRLATLLTRTDLRNGAH